jgi:predicted porin
MTSFNSDVLLDRAATNQNRYSIGITQPIGPVTLGVGYMGGENKIAATGDQDPESKSIGLRYVAGPVGLGAQYFINNNPTTTATKNEDKQRTVSGTYALTKELSVGLIYTVQENTALGVTDPDKIKQTVFQAGYNLGPVVFQGDYVRVRDAQYIANQEVDAIKLKAKVNF